MVDIGMFAEMLSEGMTVLEIRKRTGLTEGAAGKFMKQIRDDLGVPVRD